MASGLAFYRALYNRVWFCRFHEDHSYYELTRKAAGEFAKLGFTILTGGGPGLMEAANRGAQEVGGRSVGCNIQLPIEQQPNAYLDKWVYMKQFFLRKVLLVKYSFAFVVMPGVLAHWTNISRR
jgi:uncharacterized protein (TIGR00730 family)